MGLLLGHGFCNQDEAVRNGVEVPMTMSHASSRTSGIAVVLAGIDFSDLSLEALNLARGLAADAAGELHLVHVLPLPPTDALVATRASRELRYAELAGEIQTKLEGLVDTVPPPIRRIS